MRKDLKEISPNCGYITYSKHWYIPDITEEISERWCKSAHEIFIPYRRISKNKRKSFEHNKFGVRSHCTNVQTACRIIYSLVCQKGKNHG